MENGPIGSSTICFLWVETQGSCNLRTSTTSSMDTRAWPITAPGQPTRDFQLDLQQDFDPDMGELEVIPQELGRVFLNMVSNACYATDQKRRTAAEAGGDPYMPTLLLTTRREEDHAEVRIRDNGSGMPPEVIEKIFNPFFTTKPANEGTGLGLAMSRRHRAETRRSHSRRIRTGPVHGNDCRNAPDAALDCPGGRGGNGSGSGARGRSTPGACHLG